MPAFVSTRTRPRPARGRWWSAAALALGVLAPSFASADAVVVDPSVAAEAGYAPVAELSHEAIVEPDRDGRVRLSYRIALNNASAVPRDAVVTWGLPPGARIEGLAVLRDGTWQPARAVRDAGHPAARDAGSVFVRRVAGPDPAGIAAAELVAFQIPPETTIQVEVRTQVVATVRAGRYEVRLPERGRPTPGVAPRRRILVRGVPRFWVDGTPNLGAPVLEVEARRENVVAWPATQRRRSGLVAAARAEPDGFGGATVDVALEMGRGRLRPPDHVVVLFDRSVSTDPGLPDRALAALDALFDVLPARAGLSGAVFARSASRLPAPENVRVGDFHALREGWRSEILAFARSPGTDVYGALALALDTARRGGAKRPLVVLVGDGMVPSGRPPAALARRLRGADLLLLVDVPAEYEPPGPRHPVVAFAHATGGRLAAVPLSGIDDHNARAVLDAPRVARLVSVAAKGVQFDDPPPFVPAGTRIVLHGRSDRGVPRRVEVTADVGGRRVRRVLRPRRSEPPPAAFGVHLYVSEGPDLRDGFAVPVWYDGGTRRAVLEEVWRAGRGGDGPSGVLTDAIVRSYLRIRVLPRVRVCHRHAVARHRDQGGRVVLQFEIARGEVMGLRLAEVHLAHDDPKLLACLEDAGWALDVPAARRDDRVYVVRYPVRLLPAEARAPAVSEEDQATLRTLLGGAPRHRPRRRIPSDDPLRPGPLPR